MTASEVVRAGQDSQGPGLELLADVLSDIETLSQDIRRASAVIAERLLGQEVQLTDADLPDGLMESVYRTLLTIRHTLKDARRFLNDPLVELSDMADKGAKMDS